ncbi:MAG: UvrD-helicase domain-containing protein [Candidatus Pacebacteria bacterium]|nr:UvrD-helicase domain-containing protein [Candidatus Paceibacterota bacterium]
MLDIEQKKPRNHHLNGLNPAQRDAVETIEGPLLIIAGAGAGKTRVLTHRILHLIKNRVDPSAILAITFTNKAAKEMRERVMELIQNDRELNLPLAQSARDPKPFISTFHALGVHILKEHAREIGLKRHFSIYDRSDSIRAIKEAMKRSDIDPKQFEPRKVLGIISREKGDGVSLSEFRESAGNDYLKRVTLMVWEQYEKILNGEHALDFDDLLLKSMKLLENNSTIRKGYTDTWKHILIDEYQDTNKVQYRMSELLAGDAKNICVVGDIDQNIYSWRGADIQNLLDFEKTYPGTTTILLEENYRSTKNIINASNAIIEKNKNRVPKTLFTNATSGERITIAGAYDEAAEAAYITQKVDALHRQGVPYREMAVLYRTNFQSRVLEEVFLYEDIPYQVLGTKFFDRKEVKDILAFLRAALNEESTADIKRIVDVPPRGIGKVTLLRMVQNEDHLLTPATRARVEKFRTLLREIGEHALKKKPSETIRFILTASGLETHLKVGKKEEDIERLANVHELVSLASKYDSLAPQEGIEKLLEDAALATDQDSLAKDHDAVKLMTVHASKGLEFDYVFVSGLEEGLFPQEREDDRDSEEERRLFYVALTRARTKVFLTFAHMRMIFGSKEAHLPSEFISDIPEEYCEVEGAESDTYEKSGTTEFLVIE